MPAMAMGGSVLGSRTTTKVSAVVSRATDAPFVVFRNSVLASLKDGKRQSGTGVFSANVLPKIEFSVQPY